MPASPDRRLTFLTINEHVAEEDSFGKSPASKKFPPDFTPDSIRLFKFCRITVIIVKAPIIKSDHRGIPGGIDAEKELNAVATRRVSLN
jgi:hypothetical protein